MIELTVQYGTVLLNPFEMEDVISTSNKKFAGYKSHEMAGMVS